MNILSIVSLVISSIAALIALWQGFLAKKQLEQSKQTKSETEKLLQEVKDKTQKIESISDETRKDVKEQISKLIDKQDENFKTLLLAPQKNSQNEMLTQLVPKILENPKTLETLISFSKTQGK